MQKTFDLRQIRTAMPKVVVGLGSLLLAAHAMAVTVVTPTDLQGWLLGDGSSGTSPAMITGTQPYQGNGSIQLTLSASNQQPLAFYGFSSPLSFSSLVNGSATLGYSYLLPVGSPPSTSPTIRLILSGLTNSTQTTRSDGSLGFYVNGAGDNTWHTESLSTTAGDFFFRVGGKGQEATGCGTNSFDSTFDDRRQSLASWGANCTGEGGTVGLDNALVTGIEVDFGTIPGVNSTFSVFADDVKFSIGNNVGEFNFETAAAANVPEPVSLALVGLGLAGIGAARRRRSAAKA